MNSIINISPLLFFGLCFLFFILVSLFTAGRRIAPAKKSFSYGKISSLMTERESECYKRLVSLAGNDYFVFAQVHLSSLLDERAVKGQNWKAARSHMDRKSVDFLLCDKDTISPKLAIELDDSTHSRPDRIDRDKEVERMFSEAGIPLLRIRNSSELNERLASKLAETKP